MAAELPAEPPNPHIDIIALSVINGDTPPVESMITSEDVTYNMDLVCEIVNTDRKTEFRPRWTNIIKECKGLFYTAPEDSSHALRGSKKRKAGHIVCDIFYLPNNRYVYFLWTLIKIVFNIKNKTPLEDVDKNRLTNIMLFVTNCEEECLTGIISTVKRNSNEPDSYFHKIYNKYKMIADQLGISDIIKNGLNPKSITLSNSAVLIAVNTNNRRVTSKKGKVLNICKFGNRCTLIRNKINLNKITGNHKHWFNQGGKRRTRKHRK